MKPRCHSSTAVPVAAVTREGRWLYYKEIVFTINSALLYCVNCYKKNIAQVNFIIVLYTLVQCYLYIMSVPDGPDSSKHPVILYQRDVHA